MPSKTVAPQPFDPRIDAYINKARPFAQPILSHLRDLIHKAVPEVSETIKWGHAFFEYKSRILANMAAFKEHCSLGFWGQEMTPVLKEANALHDGAMGSLGRIATLKDLPPDKQMLGFFRQAAAFIDEGKYTRIMSGRDQNTLRAAKPAPATPPDLAAALKKNRSAAKVFDAFSPSCKREYIEWITEAKRQETRDRRLNEAIAMIAEGKQRNWKYQTR